MKERPILFSGAMVRAILSGAKTQTRRIVKPQPTKTSGTHRGYPLPLMANDWAWPHPRTSAATTISNRPNGPLGWEIHCPYGQPGDRLWVREAWSIDPHPGPNYSGGLRSPDGGEVMYRATDGWHGPWRPSIHMPHWASRLTLEITGVRVERLKEIGAADAMEEGVAVHADHYNKPIGHPCSPVMAYRDLWEYINGPGSWDANPWVWVVEFRRIVADHNGDRNAALRLCALKVAAMIGEGME
jgi:hypothetical protein